MMRVPTTMPMIVSLDLANPIKPQPLIAELMRTWSCTPGCTLLVEKIDASVVVTPGFRAVRLLLSDGELCMQALLGSETHGLVDSGRVYVGCYVKLYRFEMREVEVGVGGRPAAPGARKMVYLRIDDLAPVGHNTAILRMVEGPARSKTSATPPRLSRQHKPKLRFALESPIVSTTTSQSPTKSTQITTDHDLLDTDDAFESMDVTEPTPAQRRLDPSPPHPRHSHESADQLTTLSHPPPAHSPITEMKLTPLASISRPPMPQNWTVNVLAVVTYVSDLEPTNLQPRVKRTVRLADRSTTKHVMLSVFLDPDKFCPRIGSVVLLVGVKNHRYDGGSLNKYASTRLKEGERWWCEDPVDLEWCDVVGLKEWWASKRLG